ncbi:MAG: hypothetical protein V4530_00460 [Pseudomonadota bacterium]
MPTESGQSAIGPVADLNLARGALIAVSKFAFDSVGHAGIGPHICPALLLLC